jgi:hypothetical protein
MKAQALSSSVESLARQAVDDVLELVLNEGEPVVVVDSPPGAGKTSLVEALVATAVLHAGLRVLVVTPRAEQAFDLLRRLVADYVPLPMQLLKAAGRELPASVAAIDGLRVVDHAEDLVGGAGVTVSTVAKAFLSVPHIEAGEFDILVCDEAYQVTYKDFVPLFEVSRQTVLVGDPGQLPPLVEADTARFEAARYRVHWPVPREVLRRFPEVPVVKLPASRRLPQDTVDLIQPSFYPELPFRSAAPGDRRLELEESGSGDVIDRALDLLANGASVVGIVLPPAERIIAGVDEEVAEVMAEVVARATFRSTQLSPSAIGCVDPHVASGSVVRRHLQRRGMSTDDVMVDTPEIWQGLERRVMVVKHPLSGIRRLGEFTLEPGRFCVALSRHQVGCIVVTRDGVGEDLDAHSHNCADRALGAENAEWKGWRAHQRLWSELERRGRLLHM